MKTHVHCCHIIINWNFTKHLIAINTKCHINKFITKPSTCHFLIAWRQLFTKFKCFFFNRTDL